MPSSLTSMIHSNISSLFFSICNGGNRLRKNHRCRKQWWLLLAAFLTLLPSVSSAAGNPRDLERYSVDYYKSPALHWMIRLEGEELVQGNGVVQSPLDDNIVYITTHSGTLLVLSTTDGSTLATISPDARTRSENGVTVTSDMYCSSGIAFGELSTGEPFLVYSIVDQPPVGDLSTTGPKTRVVAVSIPEHDIIWSSAGLPGDANGSPAIYVNQYDSKNYVVLTHNSQLVKPDNTTLTTGHITMLQTVKGHVVWTESEWTRDEIPRGYGPPAVASNPLLGKFAGGLQNRNDFVVWTSSEDEGRGQLGNTYAFQCPGNFQETTDQVSALKSQLLKKVRWNAITRPVLSANGTNLFVGVTGSELRGWVGDTLFDETAVWAIDLVQTSVDPFAAIPATPTLSNDEERLFVSSASTEMACIDTQTGLHIWRMSGTSPLLAETRASPDDLRVYAIQSADGRIFCQDQLTGELQWIGSCDLFEEDCANSVRADFDLSSTGQFLYYGDVMGRIIALKLGEVMENSEPAASPDRSPGGGIDLDLWPTENGQGEGEAKSGPTLGGSVTLIILATMIAVGSSMYIILMNRYKSIPHPQQEPQSLESIETTENADDDYALHINPGNGPDPYEDSMISQHTNRSKSPTESGWNNRSSPKSVSLDDSFDNASDASSHAPADRISKLLGTTNRITPIKEDFSYGASVLV